VNTVLVEQIDCTFLLELLVWGFKGVFSSTVCGKVVENSSPKSGIPHSVLSELGKIIVGELF
jgi:hypothetical protein